VHGEKRNGQRGRRVNERSEDNPIDVTESKMTVRTIQFVTAASPDFLFPSRTWLKTINLEDFAYGR
jgi:hypothetical protein